MAIDSPGSTEALASGMIHDSSTHPDSLRMEARLLNALQGLNPGNNNGKDSSGPGAVSPPSSSSNATAGNSSIVSPSNSSHAQGKGLNGTALNLTSVPGAENLSSPGSKLSGAPGGTTMTTSSSLSPNDVNTNTQGSFQGYWGMEANKHTIGGPKIHSRTFLTGNFDVDKTVKFSE